MGMLRGLYSATDMLRICLQQLRKQPLHSLPQIVHFHSLFQDVLFSFPISLVNLLSASALVVEFVLGDDKVNALVEKTKTIFARENTASTGDEQDQDFDHTEKGNPCEVMDDMNASFMYT